MAAGLGFKTFTTGEVLTAADTNGYLMQGILVFASAAARDAAITSPQEGQFAYLKDTNVTTYYTGSAWANVDTTGMTNPMTTTGDTIYSSSGSTPARLGIGSTGQVLTVAAGIPSWATPASGGGMTLLTTMSLSGSSVTSSSFSSSYKALKIYVKNVIASTAAQFYLRLNGDTGANYSYRLLTNDTSDSNFGAANEIRFSNTTSQSDPNLTNYAIIDLMTPSDTDSVFIKSVCSEGTGPTLWQMAGVYDNAAAITSVTLFPGSGTFTSGSALIYGVN